MRAPIASLVAASVMGWLVAPAVANDVSQPMAAAALSLCKGVEPTPGDDKIQRLARLDEGVRMSEAAVAADSKDPRAYLALFCNLDKQLDAAGLSWRAFDRLRRAQAAINRAHQLAPDDPDVLVAKGELLRHVPRPLGGDPTMGLALFRRAVEVAPDHVAARLHLARAMAEDRVPGARAKVYEALAVAKRRGARREESEAQALLASLDD